MPNYINILVAGATFLLLYLIIINLKKVNRIANRWFAGFVFCLLVLTNIPTLVFSKTIPEESMLLEGLLLFIFLIAPLFYLSIQYYIKPNQKWKKRQYLHFGLSFLYLFLFIISFSLDAKKAQNEETSPSTMDNANYFLCLILAIQVFSYCTIAYKNIIKHQKNIVLHRSSIENINLDWLKKISIIVSIMGFFWVVDILFQLSENYFLFDLFTSSLNLLIVLYIAHFWSQQEEIYPYTITEIKEIKEVIKEANTNDEQKKKILTDENLEKLKTELLVVMEKEKPFLDSEISLVKLAQTINISAHLLSYVINNGFDENFFQFINGYRIKEAKKLILDTNMNHLSLLGIGFEVGFNSKTVFNTTFKKVTGKTPSEFKKSSSDL